MVKIGDEYIIRIGGIYSGAGHKVSKDETTIPPGMLYRIEGFNSLVFDERGLAKLEKVEPQEGIKKDAYERGLQDAWDAARYIMDLTSDPVKAQMVVGNAAPKYFIMSHTAEEAISTIKEYEQKNKEQENEIRAGDEVIKISNGDIGIVIRASDETCNNHVLFQDGSEWLSDFVIRKTGRYFPEVKKLLEESIKKPE